MDGIVARRNHFASTMPMESIALDAWERAARVHLIAPAALAQACFPLLKESPDASVVFPKRNPRHRASRAYWGGFATKSALAHLVGNRLGRRTRRAKAHASICSCPARSVRPCGKEPSWRIPHRFAICGRRGHLHLATSPDQRVRASRASSQDLILRSNCARLPNTGYGFHSRLGNIRNMVGVGMAIAVLAYCKNRTSTALHRT